MEELLSEFRKLNISFPTDGDVSTLIVADSSTANTLYYVLLASLLSENENSSPFLYHENEDIMQLESYRALGIKDAVSLKKWNYVELFYSTCISVYMIARSRSRSRFLKTRYRDILIGDLIYDSYVRIDQRYRNFKISRFSFIKEVIKCVYRLRFYEKLVVNSKVRAIVLNHIVYIKLGLLSRIVAKHNGRVYCIRNSSVRVYSTMHHLETVYEYKPSQDIVDQLVLNLDKNTILSYIEKRLSGDIDEKNAQEAFKNKMKMSKHELCKRLNLTPSKPLAFIMAHAFSDAPHGLGGQFLYDDYYHWYVETLKMISTIDDVNWIIKPHPSSHWYGEQGIAEETFSNYRSDNMRLSPLDLSTASILEMADGIITVGGSIGLEFAVSGKKAVICSDTLYSGWGIAIEPRSKEEYYRILKNIRPERLSPYKLKVAYSILYWWYVASSPSSLVHPLETITPNVDQKQVEKMRLNLAQKLLENLKKHNVFEDELFLALKDLVIKKYDRIYGKDANKYIRQVNSL